MSFTGWEYPFFLAAIFGVYWSLRLRGRWWLLMLSSYAFYATWDARFLALLLSSTAIDYFCGRALAGERRPIWQIILACSLPALWLGVCALSAGIPGNPLSSSLQVTPRLIGLAGTLPLLFTCAYILCWRQGDGRVGKAFLALSIGSNLVTLGFFKYFNFFRDSLQTLLSSLGWETGWPASTVILPVAISFYTFQSISYAVDIYRRRGEPARDYVLFSAYLAFFPQLVAGPIERVGRFLPQFESPRIWRMDHLHIGLRLIVTGLFKKIVVADNCAVVANYAFDSKDSIGGPMALLGALAFAFQIYGDFSGYTDLARGSARLLGIELSSNFEFPYSARGPAEFWQRWHKTLSSWFRDYVYIPLGGNRKGPGLEFRNVWITMALAGIWHGASWNFLIWGFYHAAILSLYRLCRPLSALETAPSGIGRGAAVGLMFLWTLLGWVFFRCTSLPQLGHWFGALGDWTLPSLASVARPTLWIAIHVAPLLLLQWSTRAARDEMENTHWRWPVRGLAYAAAVMAIASSSSQHQEFLYFQF